MKNRIIIYILIICVVCLGMIVYVQSVFQEPDINITDLPYLEDDVLLPEADSSNIKNDDKRIPITKANWMEPVLISSLPLFKKNTEGELYVNTNENTKFYRIGNISEGIHQNKDILRVSRPYSYPGDDGLDYVLATKSASGSYTKFELLMYTDSYWSENEDGYDISKVTPLIAKFTELEMPEKIQIKDITFSYVTTLGVWVDNSLVKKVATADGVGDVYLASDGESVPMTSDYNNGTGGFYVKTKDSRVALYKPDYLNKVAGELITGEKYRYVDLGGCGASNVTSVVNFPMSDFEIIGKSIYDNEPIYELKDKNNKIYRELYGMAYFDGEYDLEKKISFEEFVKKQPIIFWKDSFGRMIKFSTLKLLPITECGKPVIYLYPEETTTVSVKVLPEGGFSKTIPDYGNGWNVIATPESEITNLADGSVYPYLFWEGRGGLYESPKQGFVVKQNEVEKFLDSTLAEYGLIKKEIKDFKEFWLPRMTGHPYYFVSFYDNKIMDELAPLNITPKPDTIIRVLMDFKGLEKPIDVTGYKIPHRERKGFTVVEWGGVIK